ASDACVKARRERPMTSPNAQGLILEPIARLEDPPDYDKAEEKEARRHGEAYSHSDVGDPIESPPKAVDEVDDRIEQRDALPGFGQHREGIERAAEKRERRDDEHRHDLQLLESVRPDAEDEAKQAEGGRGQHQKSERPQGMHDLKRHEQARSGEDHSA